MGAIPYYLQPPNAAPIPGLGEQIAAAKAQQAQMAALPPPVLNGVPPMATAAMPSLPAPKMPVVQHSQAIDNQNEVGRLEQTGSGISQIQNPFLRVLARTADAVGSTFLPGVERNIGGTEGRHNTLLNQAEKRVGFDDSNALQQAQVAQTQATTRHTNDVSAGLEAPSGPEYDYVDGPNGKVAIQKGTTNFTPLTDAASGAPLGAKAPTATNPFELWHQQNPTGTVADYNNLESKPLTQAQADALNGITDGLATKHGLPAGQFKAGMPHADALQLQTALYGAVGKQQGDTHIVIQQTGQNQRASQLASRNGALDFSNPNSQAIVQSLANGDVGLNEVLPRGASFAQRAALVAQAKAINPEFNSGDHNIENSVRKYMTSGAGGQTITAGNTLAHHLDLRDQAISAIDNGNVVLANKIGNELGLQLGSDKKTNLALINQGVATEAARFYTGGVPGEHDINQFLIPLSGDGSPAQMINGGKTVRAMAAGKQMELQGQANAGAKGKANFLPAATAVPDGAKVRDYTQVNR